MDCLPPVPTSTETAITYQHWSALMLTFYCEQPEMRQILMERDARGGMFDAMLFGDDVAVEMPLLPGKSTLPAIEPKCRFLLACTQRTFAVDRLLEPGVVPDTKDRWDPTSMVAMRRPEPRESLEPDW